MAGFHTAASTFHLTESRCKLVEQGENLAAAPDLAPSNYLNIALIALDAYVDGG